MNHMTLSFFDVDLVTIVMVYLLISYGQTGACIFAFTQGLLIDIFSAGLLGLFTLIYMSVFLGLVLGSRFFHLYASRGLILLVILAVLLKEILFTVLLGAFDFEIAASYHALASRASSAVCSGLIAPLVFHVFNRINRLFAAGTEETV